MPSVRLHKLLADAKFPVLYCLERDCPFPVVCQSVRAMEQQIYLVLARIL
jgi:hypothetical protein